MNIYTLDGQNVPESTIRQKYQEFIANGGISENFALRTNPKEQVDKIVVMRAFFKGGVIAFLSREINPNRSFITTLDISGDDIEKLKIKTTEDMNAALRDVARTQKILTGRNISGTPGEDVTDLGYHTIRSR